MVNTVGMQPLGATWPALPGVCRPAGTDLVVPSGWSVEVVAETGSTNADLLGAARRGAVDRSVLVACHQTAGRGRLDRRWEAPPGVNLLMSMLFRTVPDEPHELTRRVALAAADAAAAVAGVSAELKWPNDLLVEGAKLAGILAQAGPLDAVTNRIDHVVVGIGVNVGWAPDGAALIGDSVHPLEVLVAVLAAFDRLPPDPLSLHELYRSRLATIGRRVRVERVSGSFDGRAVDVEADGRLVVLDDCAVTHRVDTGDIIHLRQASGGG